MMLSAHDFTLYVGCMDLSRTKAAFSVIETVDKRDQVRKHCPNCPESHYTAVFPSKRAVPALTGTSPLFYILVAESVSYLCRAAFIYTIAMCTGPTKQ